MIVNAGDEFARQEVFRKELLSDESIEWTGQPDPSIVFSKMDAFLVPFSLMWGGFAIFWELSVTGILFQSKGHGGPPPVLFALFGVPFVLMGLYFIFGRFFYKAWKKKRTYYAVTNRRVVTVTVGPRGRNVQATLIRDIPTINKSVGGSGVGTLIFGNSGGISGYYANTGMDWMGSAYGIAALAFYDIADANTVCELVNRLRNEPGEKRC